jgi:phage-related protein
VLQILKPCQKELAKLPDEVRGDLADAVAMLEEGHSLSMPLSRPMPSIGAGVHELRFRDRAGVYRVFYVLATSSVWLLHAHMKKTSAATPSTIALVQKRLKEVQP